MNTQWKILSITVAQNIADVISNALVDFGSQGTMIEDIPTQPDHCVITGYYPESENLLVLQTQLQEYVEELRQLGEQVGQVEIKTGILENADWGSNWKQFFKPTRVGKHLVIKPSWEAFAQESGDLVIELDPGMAFGSGLHASTRLAIALLELYMPPAAFVLDVGVGSGILSIAAARLGADYVLGVDIDPDAVAVARENIHNNAQLIPSKNSLEDRIELEVGSIDTLEIHHRFDCIVMNIRPNVILSLMPYAISSLQTGGAIILSGILEEEGSALLHDIRALGFTPHHHITEDGWIAYVLSQI
ncbi:ribosomal protein L11 methyltransferase [Candidatus Moduliflexus flocculans]|uniref:Ribosomal protein L11 methyltransferase n=1 Tax=Candidatus Moduliflexus flocculans TaxID=1499966 RepID=A0A081BPY5_9BACT|nr:ribosomal protein L11 methyltransferase [Candidatus Moduliflexus flocculans]